MLHEVPSAPALPVTGEGPRHDLRSCFAAACPPSHLVPGLHPLGWSTPPHNPSSPDLRPVSSPASHPSAAPPSPSGPPQLPFPLGPPHNFLPSLPSPSQLAFVAASSLPSPGQGEADGHRQALEDKGLVLKVLSVITVKQLDSHDET